jgi:hypothetical protein
MIQVTSKIQVIFCPLPSPNLYQAVTRGAPIHEVTLREFERTLNSLENHVALLKRELGE